MRLKHATMLTRVADQGIALPAPCTLLINFLHHQLSFHVLKLLSKNCVDLMIVTRRARQGCFRGRSLACSASHLLGSLAAKCLWASIQLYTMIPQHLLLLLCLFRIRCYLRAVCLTAPYIFSSPAIKSCKPYPDDGRIGVQHQQGCHTTATGFAIKVPMAASMRVRRHDSCLRLQPLQHEKIL